VDLSYETAERATAFHCSRPRRHDAGSSFHPTARRERFYVRFVFWLYVSVIAAGLAAALVAGLAG
jgi:hypothetical protein